MLAIRDGVTRVFRAFGILLEGKAFKELLDIDTYDDRSCIAWGIKRLEGDGSRKD